MIFAAVLIFCATPLIVGLWGFLRVTVVSPFTASQKLPLCDAKAKRTTTADRSDPFTSGGGANNVPDRSRATDTAGAKRPVPACRLLSEGRNV